MQTGAVQKIADDDNDVSVPVDQQAVAPLMTQEGVDALSTTPPASRRSAPRRGSSCRRSRRRRHDGTAVPGNHRNARGPAHDQKDRQGLRGALAGTTEVFAWVPAGIAHDEPLAQPMQGAVGDHERASSLPSFALPPWLFIVPASSLIGRSGWASPRSAGRRTQRCLDRPEAARERAREVRGEPHPPWRAEIELRRASP